MKRIVTILSLALIMFSSHTCQHSTNPQELELSKQLLALSSVHNARQLGGYRIGNKRIKDGLLLRCGALSEMSAADSAHLTDTYQVQRVYDFRGIAEQQSAPDVLPAHATAMPLSIVFIDKDADMSEVNLKEQQSLVQILLQYAETPMMQKLCTELYDKIFFEPASQEVYRRFFEDLLQQDPDKGAVLWHCTQGKDRAGSASAMLLAALGADRDLIMADFTLSKAYYDPVASRVPAQTEAQQMAVSTLLSANPALFEATLDKVDAQYGSLCNYLTECIGLTPEMMETLRERYLE